MSEYTTRAERAALEAEIDAEPGTAVGPAPADASVVVSVRIPADELDELRAAADETGVALSRYIREASLTGARAGGRSVTDRVRHLAADAAALRRALAA